MPPQQIEALVNAAQHTERQDIDLEHAQRIEIVLIPLDDRAVLHRGVLDRHDLIKPSLRDNETADMLR